MTRTFPMHEWHDDTNRVYVHLSDPMNSTYVRHSESFRDAPKEALAGPHCAGPQHQAYPHLHCIPGLALLASFCAPHVRDPYDFSSMWPNQWLGTNADSHLTTPYDQVKTPPLQWQYPVSPSSVLCAAGSVRLQWQVAQRSDCSPQSGSKHGTPRDVQLQPGDGGKTGEGCTVCMLTMYLVFFQEKPSQGYNWLQGWRWTCGWECSRATIEPYQYLIFRLLPFFPSPPSFPLLPLALPELRSGGCLWGGRAQGRHSATSTCHGDDFLMCLKMSW